MKTYSRAGVTLVTAATVLLASAGIAQGYDPNAPATSVAMQIAEVAPKADVVDTAEHDDQPEGGVHDVLGGDHADRRGDHAAG